jgi:hypothetical protein
MKGTLRVWFEDGKIQCASHLCKTVNGHTRNGKCPRYDKCEDYYYTLEKVECKSK